MSTTGRSTFICSDKRELMSRTRLHISRPLSANTEFELTGDPARYVGRVLRLGPDDVLTLFDGRGGEYPATILSLGKNKVVLTIRSAHLPRRGVTA